MHYTTCYLLGGFKKLNYERNRKAIKLYKIYRRRNRN